MLTARQKRLALSNKSGAARARSEIILRKRLARKEQEIRVLKKRINELTEKDGKRTTTKKSTKKTSRSTKKAARKSAAKKAAKRTTRKTTKKVSRKKAVRKATKKTTKKK